MLHFLCSWQKLLWSSAVGNSVKVCFFFHQVNAPIHTYIIAMAAMNDYGFELIQHSPYLPDLAPSGFHLLPKLEKATSGTSFQSDDDVIHAVEDYLESQEKAFFKSSIEALQHHWQKCRDIERDYCNTICLPKVKYLQVRLTIFQSALV